MTSPSESNYPRDTGKPVSEHGENPAVEDLVDWLIDVGDMNDGPTPSQMRGALSFAYERGLQAPRSEKSRSDDPPCETCNGDPAVCATVPGLRHCEAANRENAAPQPSTATVFPGPSQEGLGQGDAAAAAPLFDKRDTVAPTGDALRHAADEASAIIGTVQYLSERGLLTEERRQTTMKRILALASVRSAIAAPSQTRAWFRFVPYSSPARYEMCGEEDSGAVPVDGVAAVAPIAEAKFIEATKAWLACDPASVSRADLRYSPGVIALLGDDRQPVAPEVAEPK